MNVSVARKPCSNRRSWVWNLAVSTKPPTTRSWNAISISVRICTPTPCYPVVLPCTLVSPIVCKKKSPHWRRAPWKSKSSPHRNANIPSGSVVPSWPLCPPSNRCGLANKNTTKADQALFIANAFKKCRQNTNITTLLQQIVSFYLYFYIKIIIFQKNIFKFSHTVNTTRIAPECRFIIFWLYHNLIVITNTSSTNRYSF